MIEPTSKDVGRGVVYADMRIPLIEYGSISSFNETTVFVKFRRVSGSEPVQGCNRRGLYWMDDLMKYLEANSNGS